MVALLVYYGTNLCIINSIFEYPGVIDKNNAAIRVMAVRLTEN